VQQQNTLKEEIRQQSQAQNEAQSRYENSLLQHADTIKSLETKKEEINKLRTEYNLVQTQKQTNEQNLKNLTQKFNETKQHLETRITNLEEEKKETLKQNDLLMTQLEHLTLQAKQYFETTTTTFGNTSETSPSGTENKSIADLHEIIRYLRKEKDITTVELESLSQIKTRLEQEIEIQKQMNEENKKLLAEQLASTKGPRTAEEHKQGVDHVQAMNELREINHTLKDQTSRLTIEVKTWQEKQLAANKAVTTLETEIAKIKALNETLAQNKSLAEEESKRWKARSDALIEKHQQIDSEQHQKLLLELDQTKKGFEAFKVLQEKKNNTLNFLKANRKKQEEKYTQLNQKYIEVQKSTENEMKQKPNEDWKATDSNIRMIQMLWKSSHLFMKRQNELVQATQEITQLKKERQEIIRKGTMETEKLEKEKEKWKEEKKSIGTIRITSYKRRRSKVSCYSHYF